MNLISDVPIIMCLGTQKVLADSVALRVGQFLKHNLQIKTYVYGTMEKNIDAYNIKDYYQTIKKQHPLSPILVVDSAICKKANFKKIIAQNKGVRSVAYPTEIIGDKSILINSYCFDAADKLSLDDINKMAKDIGIFLVKYINFKLQLH